MDIQKWLQATTDRAPPDKSDAINAPSFMGPQPTGPKLDGHHYRRRTKKRESSDSSIIAQDYSKCHARDRKRPKRRQDDQTDESDLHQPRTSDTRSRKSTLSEAPSKTYERHPRHKTKPDRYEPKTKKAKKERKARTAKDAERKRRRLPRNDGERTTGLIQSFQLKNGSKNNRLTLKPDTSAGIFKHGRASAQMTGRGSGLPDLVFNEMKFLQRPTDHQDELVPGEASKQDGKRNKQRVQNEEISAYFTAENAVHDDPSKLSKRQTEPTELHEGGQDGEDNERKRRKPPSVELPDKPFLGFGSKGIHGGHDHDQHDESTGYYSWSESNPGRPRTANAPPNAAPVSQANNEIPLGNSKDVNRSSMRKNAHDLTKDSVPRKEEETGQWIQSRRARGPCVVEVYQPTATQQQQATGDRTSITRTTLQSLPRRPTHRKQREGNDLQQAGHVDRVRSDYRTSDILDLPDSQNALSVRGSAGYLARLPAKNVLSDKENVGPRSSLDRLLSQARKATEYEDRDLQRFTEATHEPTAQDEVDPHSINTNGHYGSHRIPFDQLTKRKHMATTRRQPKHIEQTREGRFGQALGLDPRFNVPELYFERAVTRDERREYSQEQLNDDEMLDDGPDIHPPYWPDTQVYASGRQAEDLVFRATSVPRSGFLEAQTERLESESHGRSFKRESISRRTVPSYVSSIGREIMSERFEPPQSEADDVFAGFWKPNKLY